MNSCVCLPSLTVWLSPASWKAAESVCGGRGSSLQEWSSSQRSSCSRTADAPQSPQTVSDKRRRDEKEMNTQNFCRCAPITDNPSVTHSEYLSYFSSGEQPRCKMWKYSFCKVCKLTGKTSGSSLHICRNLSGRADECSGPWEREGELKKTMNTVSDMSHLLQRCCENEAQLWLQGGVTASLKWDQTVADQAASFLPFPPCREEAAARCRSVWPTWPDRSWWTGRWYTELCCWSLQTGPPTESVRWDLPWQNPIQNLHTEEERRLSDSRAKIFNTDVIWSTHKHTRLWIREEGALYY